MVFRQPADNKWTNFPISTELSTPLIKEKPYVTCGDSCNAALDQIKWSVIVPGLRTDAVGTDNEASKTLDVDTQFYILSTEKGTTSAAGVTTLDTTAITEINAALAQGKSLLIAPGVYNLDGGVINVTQNNTIVLGLGVPSLVCTNKVGCIVVSAEQGVQLAGLTFDAGYNPTPNLLQVGTAKNGNNNKMNPIVLSDIYFRIAETQLDVRVAGQERQTIAGLVIYANNVIGDNLWIWRGDHDRPSSHDMNNPENNLVKWNQSLAKYGLIVYGDNVFMYGLAVEHFQDYQTVWYGEYGQVHFYQSEMPYDVPTMANWTCTDPQTGVAGVNGCASYVVNANVRRHNAVGVGIYNYFVFPNIKVPSAILAPNTISIDHIVGKWLNGDKSTGIINMVTNGSTNQKCWGYSAQYDASA